jgi:hypothetical protein
VSEFVVLDVEKSTSLGTFDAAPAETWLPAPVASAGVAEDPELEDDAPVPSEK